MQLSSIIQNGFYYLCSLTIVGPMTEATAAPEFIYNICMSRSVVAPVEYGGGGKFKDFPIKFVLSLLIANN